MFYDWGKNLLKIVCSRVEIKTWSNMVAEVTVQTWNSPWNCVNSQRRKELSNTPLRNELRTVRYQPHDGLFRNVHGYFHITPGGPTRESHQLFEFLFYFTNFFRSSCYSKNLARHCWVIFIWVLNFRDKFGLPLPWMMIGQKSRAIFSTNQRQQQNHFFSRVRRRLRVFSLRYDWFKLSASIVIGQRNLLLFWFYVTQTSWEIKLVNNLSKG